VYIQNEEQIK